MTRPTHPATERHPSHVTRYSDSSVYDERCINCGATDQVPGGWGKLGEPCPKAHPATDAGTDVPADVRELAAEASRAFGESRTYIPMQEFIERAIMADRATRSADQPQAVEAGSDKLLPCDVQLPPSTIIRKGVKLSTLLFAIEQRSRLPDEDCIFTTRPDAASISARAKEDERDLDRIPASELTDDELKAAMDRAEDRFEHRGEHGGSPGEWAYERMCEIETEQKRRTASRARPQGTEGGEG